MTTRSNVRVSAIPASSMITNVSRPTTSASGSSWPIAHTSLAKLSATTRLVPSWRWLRSSSAAAADGAKPSTFPPLLVHAAARARMAVVLPVPAGAMASCSWRPEVAISWTKSCWPGFKGSWLARDWSSAKVTEFASTVRPPPRPAVSIRRCSAHRIRCDVYCVAAGVA